MKTFLVVATVAFACSLSTTRLQADLVTSGDFTGTAAGGGVGTPTITFENDLTFNITAATGIVTYLTFDEWVVGEDGGQSAVLDSPSSQQFAYEVNGAADTRFITSLSDNFSHSSEDWSENDGLLNFGGVFVTLGDSFTIKAGSYTFTQNAQFNPLLENQNFSGNIFLANSVGQRLSNNVSAGASVPELSSLMFFTFGLAVIGFRGRTRQLISKAFTSLTSLGRKEFFCQSA